MQPVTAAVALVYLFIVFQEGAMLQDVGGVRRVPGERQEVSVVARRDTDHTKLPEHLTQLISC
jgi:hypothetical protein